MTNEVDLRLAHDINTSPDVLAELAKDQNYVIRYHVAENMSTPSTTLAELADDAILSVRYHLSMNPNAPVSALLKLAVDIDWGVRWRVAENPNTPRIVRDYLSGKPVPAIVPMWLKGELSAYSFDEILAEIG